MCTSTYICTSTSIYKVHTLFNVVQQLSGDLFAAFQTFSSVEARQQNAASGASPIQMP